MKNCVNLIPNGENKTPQQNKWLYFANHWVTEVYYINHAMGKDKLASRLSSAKDHMGASHGCLGY